MTGRIYALGAALVLAFVALAWRLAYVQIQMGPALQREASRNAVRTTALAAPRGNILDCRGRLLVRNRPRFILTFIPAQVKGAGAAPLLTQLGKLLQLPPRAVLRLRSQAHEAPLEPVLLKERLDDAGLARVAELQGEFPGLTLEAQPVRDYPYRTLACHLLGNIGEIDPDTLKHGQHHAGEWVGKDGLELHWQSQLRGLPGARVTQVDAAGRAVRTLRERPPQPGHDLRLTLDIDLQQSAEKALASRLHFLKKLNHEPEAGVVVAMEADTGRIKAMVSLPGYDPGWFSQGASSRQFQALLNDRRAPLLNRAIGGAYPPGSTFKLITSTAALGEGLVPPQAHYFCTGQFRVGDLPFFCFVRTGHGALTFEQSLSYSCDVVFYMLGVKLGVARLHRYAAAFGLGKPTGVDLPGETGGILPDPAYKRKARHERWFAGDDANMAIGQGFLAVTPLQMAVVTAAIANGGKIVRPHLVDQVTTAAGSELLRVRPVPLRHLSIKPAHLQRIREGMRGAVAFGTAARANDPQLPLAGKTGTVENLPGSENPKGRNHTWFVCYGPLRPGPKLVVVVFLERSGGYGGALAAPIAHDVVAAWEAPRFIGPLLPAGFHPAPVKGSARLPRARNRVR